MVRRAMLVAALAVVALAATLGGIFGRRRPAERDAATDITQPIGAATANGLARVPGASIDATIANLEDHLARVPGDYPGWATLGLAFVQKAKLTVNSDYYPRAHAVLDKSRAINDSDNFLAYAGLSALAAARHEFAEAEAHARKGLTFNASSPILYGALSDALVQLGRYDEADRAVAKMASLRPDTGTYARQSYLRELRGDLDGARLLMQQALNAAPTAADRAFALYFLGELDFNAGDPNAALARYREALAVSPSDFEALAGKAKAEAALGQHLTAIGDYKTVVSYAPEPGVVWEFGRFLESIGRHDEARTQYDTVKAAQRLFEANQVAPDATMTLYLADRGEPAAALASAERGIATRPFVAMQDAYAWALHVNGRDHEALAAIDRAREVGTRSALFHYHAGMINLSLGRTDAAHTELRTALAINPYFDPLAAPAARRALESLGVPA